MKSSGSLVKSTKNNMLSEIKSLSNNNNNNNNNSLMVKKSLIDYRKEYQEIIQKGKDEKNRIRFLNNSLQIRPYDISIINKLIDLAYSRQDDIAAVLAINKLLNLDKCTSKHYLMLGKIYFRRWYKDCSIDALYKSCEYYHTAMKYPDFHRKECLSSPIHYFEMFSILVRLGHYQQSLDILGIIVVHYKDFIEWNYLVQYNIAQVLLLLGNIKKSILLYQQLLLSPLIVEIDLSEHIDHVYYNTKRIVNVYLTLEYAHLLHITGNIKLSKQLYSETFDRMTKYNFNNTTNNVIDFRFTCSKFEQWYNDYNTYKKLGDIFKNELNLVMAAQFYNHACELLFIQSSKVINPWEDNGYNNPKKVKDFDDMDPNDQVKYIYIMLDKGEVLAELYKFDQSEACGHFAYEKFPNNIIIVGRAAKCCNIHKEYNNIILTKAKKIMKATRCIINLLKGKIAKRKRLINDKKGLYASKIQAMYRMIKVRDQTVSVRLGNVYNACRIGPLLRYYNRVHLLIHGKKIVQDYIILWGEYANTIIRFLRQWRQKRAYNIFWNGMKSLKRIFIGQVVRLRIRKYINELQKILDQNMTHESRVQLQLNPSIIYGVNWFEIDRLDCSMLCLTSDANTAYSNFSLSYDSNYLLNMKKRNQRAVPKQEYDLNSNLSVNYNSLANKFSHAKSGEGGIAWFKGNSSVDSISNSSSRINLNNNNNSISTIATEISNSKYNRLDLEKYINKSINSGEDVISLLSYKSTIQDPSVQWIPFGICPDEAIKRLLTCTVLAITSPSFSMNDSKRLCNIARKSYKLTDTSVPLWNNIQSLLLYGTKMGPSGILGFLNLGISKLTNLSLGYTGITHHCTSVIGRQLFDKNNPLLIKLSIEGEHIMGDRGAVELLKLLQYNNSLKILTLRDCLLSSRTAIAFARFIVINQSLQVGNLNDNKFDYNNILTILRAVSNKGAKGVLKSVSLTGQSYHLSTSELLKINELAQDISVRIVSPDLPVHDEYKQETKRNNTYDKTKTYKYYDLDKKELDNIATGVHELAMNRQLDKGEYYEFSKVIYL